MKIKIEIEIGRDRDRYMFIEQVKSSWQFCLKSAAMHPV